MAVNSKKRVSLSLKLNFLIVSIILLITGGLVFFSYRVYSKKISELFIEQSVSAAEAAKEELIPDLVRHFWNEINTDEFRNVRENALRENDEKLIADWMHSRPSGMDKGRISNIQVDIDAVEDVVDQARGKDNLDLYLDYEMMNHALEECQRLFNISDVYIQHDENGVTYNLIDPAESLFYIGSVEEQIDVFADYNDNDFFPPTIYHSEFGWLLTTLLPLENTSDNEIPGYVGIDTDMNYVVNEQRLFLMNSAIYVLVLTGAAVLISMFLLNRAAVAPLKQLSQAASAFAKHDGKLTEEDVTRLPIRSNDEIGDLYRQIRSMQSRIVDYTDNLTRITAERERSRTELHTAKKIQRSMLPEEFPAFPDRTEFDLFASMKPAREVGGDFYDFFMPDDSHLAVVIADVSDKGIPAALFMMASKILINYRTRHGGTPAEILRDVNAQLCRENNSKMFVTVWMGILDLTTGVMTCANAGHEYPFIRSTDGSFHMLRDKHGLVVGAMQKTKYTDYEMKLEPGDAVFVYTDGIPEANNADEEFYGVKRLETALNRVSNGNPRHILEHIQADVETFVNGAKQFDDLTMLCVEYKQRLIPPSESPNEN